VKTWKFRKRLSEEKRREKLWKNVSDCYRGRGIEGELLLAEAIIFRRGKAGGPMQGVHFQGNFRGDCGEREEKGGGECAASAGIVEGGTRVDEGACVQKGC